MKLLKQVGKDLLHEFAWVLFFGITASFVFTSLFGAYKAIPQVMIQKKAADKYLMNDTYFVDFTSTSYGDRVRLPHSAAQYDAMGKELEAFLEKNCSDDNLQIGTLITKTPDVYADDPMKVHYLIGALAYLTPFRDISKDKVVAAVSNDLKDMVGTKYSGVEITDIVPDDMVMHSPGSASYAGSDIRNAIFLFIPSYKLLKSVADVSLRDFARNMFFYRPDHEVITEFCNIVSEMGQGYVSVKPFSERAEEDKNYRGLMTRLIIYVTSTAALLAAMVFNTIRSLRRKASEYSIQHLFGASYGMTYARMLLFTLGYYALPLFAAIPLSKRFISIRLTTSSFLTMLAFMIVLATIVSLAELMNFKKQFSKGLRRENT